MKIGRKEDGSGGTKGGLNSNNRIHEAEDPHSSTFNKTTTIYHPHRYIWRIVIFKFG